MKLILLQDINGLGKKFDVKIVKDGYGRNFLLARNLAKIATDNAIKELEVQRAVWQKKEEEVKNKLEALAKELQTKEFHFILKTGEKGEVFGSVSKSDIKTRIYADINANLRGYIDDYLEINLPKPIKKLGACQVEVDLKKGVKISVKVIIDPLDLTHGQS